MVTGKPLDVYLQDVVFQPLCMHDTGFEVKKDSIDRLAGLYANWETAQQLGILPSDFQDTPDPEWKLFRLDRKAPEESQWAEGRKCPVLSGGGIVGHYQGGLVSTLNDMARFCMMIVHGGCFPGGSRILQEATVKHMVGHDWLGMPECMGSPQVAGAGTTGVTAKGRFGWNALGELGVSDEPAADAFGAREYGYGGMAETFWSIDPSHDLTIIWLTQQIDNFSWTSEAANLWIASRKAIARASMTKSACCFHPRTKRRRLSKKGPDKQQSGIDISDKN